jgi:hypothetical protein
MRESALEIQSKTAHSLFKKIREYMFKLTAYIIDGKPIGKDISPDNKLVYGKFD